MRIFGLEVSSARKLREDAAALSDLERQLEDIGWINLNNPNTGLMVEARESYVKMVKRSRFAYVKNPIVGQGVDLTTYYVFGDGVSDPKAKDAEVQQVITDFWTDPDNRMSLTSPVNQFKLCNKLQYDGELVFVLQPDIDGMVYIRLLDPISIAEVVYDKVDGMRPLFYRRTTGFGTNQYFCDAANAVALLKDENPDEWQMMLKGHNIDEKFVVPNTFIYHVKTNSDILDRRGIPNVYRAIDWANSNKKINEDFASFINAQSQYAVKKKVKGTKGQIDAMAARLRQNSTLTNPSGQAGATLFQNQLIDTEMVGLPNSTGQLFETGIRRTLLMMCAAFGIMEHYFGDPSTGNLATATAMELPMLKKFLAMRKLWEGIFDDIINFQLDMRIYAQNASALELNVAKNRYKVTADYADRFFDVDFPPILEKDLKPLSEALIGAKNAQLIPTETAQRIFLAAAGVNNIDEEMKKEFAEPAAPMNPFLTNGNGGPLKADAPSKKQDASFAQESGARIPASVTDERKKSLRLADKNKAIVQTMNAYVKELGSAYRKFSSRIKDSVVVKAHTNPRTQSTTHRIESSRPDVAVKALIAEMRGLGRKYIPRAASMGYRYARSHSVAAREAVRPFDAASFDDAAIQDNQNFLDRSLMPALDARFAALDGSEYSSEEAATLAVESAISSFETRVGQYASYLWTVSEKAVKEAADSGQEVNFIGVEDDHNCAGCSDALAGNPYAIEDAPVPGDQDCLGNCRHALQIVGDEALTESDIRLLVNEERLAKRGYALLA